MKVNAEQVVIFGATSGIGRVLAQELAADEKYLVLVGRDEIELRHIQSDLHIRYAAHCEYFICDLLDRAETIQTSENIIKTHPHIKEFYFLSGYLGDEISAEKSGEERGKITNVNFASAVHVLSIFANYFQEKKEGTMVVIGSVAGDRGRRSNYYYGAAKAGLHALVSGLRGRLYPHNVHVMLVKPGFVDTTMIWGKPGVFLAASPERVAKTIIRKARKKKNTMYVPWFWSIIMFIIRHLPEAVFKRLKF